MGATESWAAQKEVIVQVCRKYAPRDLLGAVPAEDSCGPKGPTAQDQHVARVDPRPDLSASFHNCSKSTAAEDIQQCHIYSAHKMLAVARHRPHGRKRHKQMKIMTDRLQYHYSSALEPKAVAVITFIDVSLVLMGMFLEGAWLFLGGW